MKESEFTREVLTEFRVLGGRGFKLHNDAEQKGLPDATVWRDGGRCVYFESKIAFSPSAAIKALDPAQRSILVSLATTDNPPLLVYGRQKVNLSIQTWQGGIIKLRSCQPWALQVEDRKKKFFEFLAQSIYQYCGSHMVNSDMPSRVDYLLEDFK